jgi:hypothetical protein
MATPLSKWENANDTTKDPLRYVRVWGCEAFVHVHDPVRRKMGLKSQRGVFVGIDAYKKGFKVFLPHRHMFVVSRDITFNEGNFPFQNNKTLDPLYTVSGNELRSGDQQAALSLPVFPTNFGENGGGATSSSSSSSTSKYSQARSVSSVSSDSSKTVSTTVSTVPYQLAIQNEEKNPSPQT